MMGADIHTFIERKMPSGEWAYMGNLDHAIHSKAFWGNDKPNLGFMFYVVNSRNYALFGRLASVRGDGRDPRGLPEDVSEMVQMFADGWSGDGHSHSWLSASDFADDYYGVEAIESGEEEPMTEYHQNTLQVDKNYAVLQFLQEMCGISGIGEVTQANEFRFVFWFDN
jgi:hypothetical protein